MPEERKKADQFGLSRETILKAFQEMSDELGHRRAAGELCLFGGTVMVLAFAARPSTKDVMDILAAYYPEDSAPVKAQYLVEGLFAEGGI